MIAYVAVMEFQNAAFPMCIDYPPLVDSPNSAVYVSPKWIGVHGCYTCTGSRTAIHGPEIMN